MDPVADHDVVKVTVDRQPFAKLVEARLKGSRPARDAGAESQSIQHALFVIETDAMFEFGLQENVSKTAADIYYAATVGAAVQISNNVKAILFILGWGDMEWTAAIVFLKCVSRNRIQGKRGASW